MKHLRRLTSQLAFFISFDLSTLLYWARYYVKLREQQIFITALTLV